MYIPKSFELNDVGEAVNFMQQYSFATLVNTHNGLPHATHLPFSVTKTDNQVIVSSHIAKANPQANFLTAGKSLVIFTEPHAYVAPRLYEKQLNVPTWNYIAVHAYGQASIVVKEELQLASLEKMIAVYDADYLQQWAQLPFDYKVNMSKGIVVFDILITDLQGKKKLSQNRSAADQQSVALALTNSNDTNEQHIAKYMQAVMYKA